MLKNFIIGISCSFIIAYAAYKKESLNKSGFAAALILGTAIYVFGGLWFSAIMIAFFISSSVLSKFKKAVKHNVDKRNSKGSNRDYMQVLANGGVGLLLALLYFVSKNSIFMVLYAASFAESNADTWASEIGVLSKTPPVSILSWKRIESGISGGISLLGSFSALAGSFFISVIFGASYKFIYPLHKNLLAYVFLCCAAGFAGCIIDSLLGASVQAQYYSEALDTLTEKSHFGEKHNRLIKGFKFFNNDLVNICSNAASTLLLALVLIFIY